MTVQQPVPPHEDRENTGHPSGPLPAVQPQPDRPSGSGNSKSAWRWIGIVVAVLLVLGLGMMLGRASGPELTAPAPGPASDPSRVGTMPNYVGQSMSAAAADLRTVGINIILTPAQAAATVAAQTPVAGTPLYTYTTDVTLTPAQPTFTAPSYTPPAPTGPLTAVPSGTYEVGSGDGQVAPGKYVAAPGSSSCYYARLRDLNGSFRSIIDNNGEYNGGQVILSVQSSDKALEVSGDCVFRKR